MILWEVTGTNKMGAGICDKVFRNLKKDPEKYFIII